MLDFQKYNIKEKKEKRKKKNKKTKKRKKKAIRITEKHQQQPHKDYIWCCFKK